MHISRLLFGLNIILLSAVTACSSPAPTATVTPTNTPQPQASTAAPTLSAEATAVVVDDPDCPLLVQEALERVDAACMATGRNQVCYGNTLVNAEPQVSIEDLVFTNPGDIAAFSDILSLQLSPMDTANNQWGVALMRLQANLPDTLIGQNVTFLLFGNAQLENTASDAQSFYFQSGVGDARCAEAPASGLLIQTPQGAGRVNFRVNGVDFALEATVYLQAQPEGALNVSVVEGEAEVTAQGETQTISAGNQTTIQLDDTRNPSGPPAEPQPYVGADLLTLPVYNLERAVTIAESVLESSFKAGDDGWTIAENNATPDYQVADDTSDGFICTQDNSATWTFNAPASWSGDRRALYGGTLNFTLRQAAADSEATPPAVLLRSAGLTLIYTSDQTPAETWTPYRVPLTENDGWFIATEDGTPGDNPPTLVQMQSVLGNLSGLRIQVMDNACLDTVQLLQERTPTAPDVRTTRPFVEPTAVSRTQSNAQVITIGQPVSASIDEIGAVDVYTFSAQAGQQIYFAALGTETNIEWRVENATGTALFDQAGLWLGNDPGAFTLDAGGYTVYVQGEADNTGSYSFFLWEVPPPQIFTLQAGDVMVDDPAPGAGVIAVPGEEDIYTFEITREQSMLFLAQGREGDIYWSLTAQDDSVLFENAGLWQGNDFGPLTLSPGTYTITVASDHGDTGTYSFSFFEALEPQTFAIKLDATISEDAPSPGAGNIEASGAVDVYTFTIEGAQEILFVALGNEDDLRWQVEDQEGVRLFEDEGLWQGNELGPFTLTAGTYTITVKTGRGSTGTYSFEVRTASGE